MIATTHRPLTEEDAQRVEMALAEAGHPSQVVLLTWGVLQITTAASLYVRWKAMAIAGATSFCWPCRRALPESFREDVPLPPPCGHHIDPFCPEAA